MEVPPKSFFFFISFFYYQRDLSPSFHRFNKKPPAKKRAALTAALPNSFLFFLRRILQRLSGLFPIPLFQPTVNHKEGGHQKRIRQNPGGGVSHARAGEAEDGNEDQGHSRPSHHFAEAAKQRQLAVSQPLNGKAHAVDQGQQHVEGAGPAQKLSGLGRNGGFPGVQEDHGGVGTEDSQYNRRHNGIGKADGAAGKQSGLHPADLPCPQVLAHIGGHGRAQSVEGTAGEVAHPVAGRHCRHRCAAQTVHCRLQDHAADGGDGVLQSHGNAHAAEIFKVPGTEPPVRLPGHQQRKLLDDVHQAGQPGAELRDHCGDGSSLHPHAEGDDKQQIQPHIQQRRQSQKHHRGAAVPQRPDQGGEQVVENGSGDAQKDDENVVVGVIQNVAGGLHPDQNLPAEHTDQDGEHQRQNHRQPNPVGHVAPQAVTVLGPKPLGHRDGNAVAHPHTESDDHKVDGAGGAHPGEGIHPQVLAYNHGIHHAVDLLKDHPQQHGNGKAQNQLPGAAGSHGLNGGMGHKQDSFTKVFRLILVQTIAGCKSGKRRSFQEKPGRVLGKMTERDGRGFLGRKGGERTSFPLLFRCEKSFSLHNPN